MNETRRPWFPPRLADVAARAATSKATASRALSRDQPAASPTTKRVRRAARDLGYRPATDRAHLLVLSTDISRTGYWATVSGVLAASDEFGVDLSVHGLSGGPQRRREILSRALDGRVDGVVLLEFDSLSVATLEDLPVDLPVAIAGGRPDPEQEEPPRAWTDDYAGAMTATRHLCDLGHEQLAYVGVPNAPCAAASPWPSAGRWRRGCEPPRPCGPQGRRRSCAATTTWRSGWSRGSRAKAPGCRRTSPWWAWMITPTLPA